MVLNGGTLFSVFPRKSNRRFSSVRLSISCSAVWRVLSEWLSVGVAAVSRTCLASLIWLSTKAICLLIRAERSIINLDYIKIARMRRQFFKSKSGEIPLPVFFPDATRAVIRTLDSCDIEETKTPGVLVNTYHLIHDLGAEVIEAHGGVRGFMNWKGGVISDSGGFQMMSLVHKNPGLSKVTDEGITFRLSQKRTVKLTPEESVRFQMSLRPDMVVVLDDFTRPGASYDEAKISIERTVAWAKRSKTEFEKICKEKNLNEENRPYILGIIQGDSHLDLRRECARALREIGFDGFGFGGWPMDTDGKFNFEVARVLAEETPTDYFLYGLGVGTPADIVGCVKLGFNIFDCVLPTRDARHGRLYVFTAPDIEQIDVERENFYEFFNPKKEKYLKDKEAVSKACDCLLCKNYSRGYLAHLFKIGDSAAFRLATIHNLRFYSLLMEKLRKIYVG